VAYTFDTELDLKPHTAKRYIISTAHRRKQRSKSRWTVSAEVEIDCFIGSDLNRWVENVVAWGVLKGEGRLLELGKNSQKESLKIAKFVDLQNTNVWHGYPADYCRNHQDRPGARILKDWRLKDIIEKHHITKIRQGKECNL